MLYSWSNNLKIPTHNCYHNCQVLFKMLFKINKSSALTVCKFSEKVKTLSKGLLSTLENPKNCDWVLNKKSNLDILAKLL